MATDGVLDNLFDDDIKFCLGKHTSTHYRSDWTPQESPKERKRYIVNVENAAKCISTLAEVKSYDKSYNSPFAVEAKKHG